MPVLGLRPAAGLLIRTAMEVNREAYMAFLKLAAEYGHACVLPEGGGETAWCTGLLAIQAKLAYAACFARDAGLLDNEIRALLGGTGGKEAGLFDPGSFTAHLRLWDAMEKMLRGSPEGRGDPASLMLMRIVYQQVYGEAEFSADRLGDINSLFCRVWDAVRPYFLIWDWIRNDFELDFSGSEAPFDSLWPGVILTMKFDPAAWKPTLDHGAVFRVVSAEDLERSVNEREEGIPWR